MSKISSFQIEAINDAESSENRIHSDEIAEKYGFKGALVSGVNVFGYLSQPLVHFYGEEFLNQCVMEVRFLKPAFQHDLITIQTDSLESEKKFRYHISKAFNQTGELLAHMESWLPINTEPANELSSMSEGSEILERKEIEWDLIELHKASPIYAWEPAQEDNSERVHSQRDGAEIYQGDNAYIHPYYLLDACNKALMRMFILPAWIHVGSKLILRSPIKINQKLAMSAIPVKKWTRKGHQFIELYICVRREGKVVLEAEHTAIFKIAS